MSPPFWPWRGRPEKRPEQADVPGTGSPPQDTASDRPVEGDSTPVPNAGGIPSMPATDGRDGLPAARRDGEGGGPVSAERSAAEGASSSVRVDVSGEGSVCAGRDITHSAIGAGSRVEHTEVDNHIENSTVRGDVYQAGNLTVTHHHPVPAPVPASAPRPVRVGTVPPLASAFQPREELRQEIDRARERNATVVLTQVLSGGGGVGKSQLAAFCAHRAHTDGVDVLVWVDATETSQIIATYAQAAAKAGVPGADGQDAERDAAAFLDWLTVTDLSWLVVLDDLTDLEHVTPWWPRPPVGTNGRVLVSTRRRDALVTGNGRAIVDIGTYTTDEAHAYLRERLTGAGSTHLLDNQADDLAKALGRLPLALAHAAAYMINEDVDCTTYLRLFTDRASRLTTLLPPGADTDGYGRQVTTSLLLALDAAGHREPAGLAVPAIRLAAHLDPAGHPQQLWTTEAATRYLTTHRTPPPPGTPDPEPVTPDQARAALRLLHHYALITHHTHDTNRAVRLHALTARAARETAPATDTPATVRAAADALVETWPEHEHTARDLTTVLRANTDILANLASDLLWHPHGHAVLFTAGHSLDNTGLIHTAVTHWQRLAADAQRLLGHDHSDTLAARSNLASSYGRAGRTSEALDLLERVLADVERLLGEDHPDILAARANLAASYRQAGRTSEAIALEERVLADVERLLGHDHPDTLTTRHNLAASYGQAGRTGEAIVLEERVLADRERVLGEDHPHTLTARSNLAASYGQVGRIGEAIVLEERVLADRERLLGEDHPHTLASRGNLASSYGQAGRTGEALDLRERVLADSERLLGQDHLDTLTMRANLAASYWRAGRTGEAIDLQERVLADRERALGEDYPGILTARGNLAIFYERAGRIGEALGLQERVLVDAERLLGHDHPDTLTARGNLASSYGQVGRIGEAIDLQERVLADAERLFGEDHPDTLTARGNLASSYGQVGRIGEALDLQERVLVDAERLLGHDHPDTLTTRHNLASSYGQAGRIGEAIDLQERVLADAERLFGEDHPDTLTARHNLASFYGRAGRTGEAIDLMERVLADRERILGHDHPSTRAAADLLRSWRSP